MPQLPDPELSYAMWMAEEEKTRQQNIVIARKYDEGEHGVKLTERQEEFLGFNLSEERFALNYCATILNAMTERMIVRGFESADEDVAAAAWEWWKASRMDALQDDIHRGMVRDGETFVFVEWNEEERRPRLYPHPRYTDALYDGTGFGCKAFFANGDPNQPITKVSKRWTQRTYDEKGKPQTRQRMTVYYPDLVQRFIRSTSDESGWELYETEDEPAEMVWEPGVIPWAHFRNPRMRSDLWDAFTVQDLINKTAVDIIAAADAAGFPMRIAEGWIPTTDGKQPETEGGNYLSLFPGCWIAVPKEATYSQTVPADISKLLEGLDSYILKLAQITDTPTSRFQLTRQVAAEGTLKQQEGPLLAKVRLRTTMGGNGWEDMQEIARRLANTFGSAGLDKEADIETQWEPAETRDEKQVLERLQIKAALGVPQEQLWDEMGYNVEQIATMKAQKAEEMQTQSNIGSEVLRAFERGGQ